MKNVGCRFNKYNDFMNQNKIGKIMSTATDKMNVKVKASN